MGDSRSLWAPDAVIPQIKHVLAVASLSTSERADATTTTASSSLDDTFPNPERDAARMAALKRLRHRMVILCSATSSCSTGSIDHRQKNGKIKPPTLAFERWLARAALRRKDANDDPIIPSDGVVDNGLVKDLARCLPSHAAARSVADEMARDGRKAAEGVAAVGRREESSQDKKAPLSMDQARGKIKDGARVVNDAAKLARKALKGHRMTSTDNGNKHDNNNGKPSNPSASLKSALASLRAATEELDAVTREVEGVTGCSSSPRENESVKISISASRRRGIFDVTLTGPDDDKPKRPYLTVSSSHLSKLLQLWSLKKRGNGTSLAPPKSSDSDPLQSLPKEERIEFSRTLYCCLARYEGLRGAGYQCAVPGIAFDAAARECGLGTTIECFASPLNCRYRTYCSAFPDVESRLGSMGSFFDDSAFNPMEGSFEANPPFVPETMLAMGQKIDRLLADDGRRGALSFLVVVPAWGAGIKFCRDMETSRHCRATTRVAAAEHAFADGAQHTKPSRSTTKGRPSNNEHQNGSNRGGGGGADLRPSSWDTAVILMQNDAGAARWPVDTKALEGSFCKALRDAARDIPEDLATLEGWERRGVARGGSSRGDGGSAPTNSSNKKHKRFR